MAVALGGAGKLVSFFGAGIYEEVLFRLTLLPLVVWGLQWFGCGPRQSLIAAIVLTSLLFSTAHYIGPHGQTLDLSTFLFRRRCGRIFRRACSSIAASESPRGRTPRTTFWSGYCCEAA